MKKSLLHLTFLFFGLFFFNSFLKAQEVNQIIQTYLETNRERLGLVEKDIQNWEITDQTYSEKIAVTHVYIRQTINGIPVSNGLANFAIKNKTVVAFGNRMISQIETKAIVTNPVLSSIQAIEKSAEQLGIGNPVALQKIETIHTQKFIFNEAGISNVPIPVELMYFALDGKLILTWDLSIKEVKGNWWSLKVDAATGQIIDKKSWTNSCHFEHCTDEHHGHSDVVNSLQFAPIPNPVPPPTAGQYNVFAIPTESPNHGPLVLITNPADLLASPFGWHDVDGLEGDEYTITRGNNVYASDDANDDDNPGYSPDGGSALDFNFALDQSISPTLNMDAAITNLFYMNNIMHDVWYQYGFDEESGNFQQNNYGNGGLASDFVYADAQDGSGTDNANFETPPDGENPRMQMYLWNVVSSNDILIVNSPAGIANSYNIVPASFGPPVPVPSITADFVLVNDGTAPDVNDGCETLLNIQDIIGKIAIIKRGNCPFVDKIQAVQDAGAIAAIVVNNSTENIFAMSSNNGGGITIPSVMISQADGQLILDQLNLDSIVNGTLQNGGGVQSGIDADFDNAVIAHEYGHGISTRLTGGPDNSDCLNNEEQMGEGWSDWFGLMLTMKSTDLPTDARGIGTYVMDEPVTGPGIRNAPYSTSFNVNSYTYQATNNGSDISMPHGIGFVWCTMLWDLNWALIDQYGFDEDVYNGTGGNNIAMHLVIEALKLQPCGPGFVDGRDAILAADELLYGGANKCLIWTVFAARGLGFSADQGDPASRSDQVEAFDIPSFCTDGLLENKLDLISIYPNPTNGSITVDFKSQKGIEKVVLTDLQGKIVYENLSVDTSNLTIDLGRFTTGIYTLSVTGKSGKMVSKVVKN